MGGPDNLFGPTLPNVFDFTLVFEQGILSLLPTCLFVLIAPFRVTHLLRHETRVASSRLLWSKLAAISLYFCLQVALVTLWSLPSTPKAKTSVAEAVIGLFNALAIAALSYAEHKKSIRPSALLNSYLFLSLLLDIALARTFWIRPDLKAIAGVFTVSLAIKAVLLAFEELPKQLLVGEKDVARETTAGVISRSVFWWLNALFFDGARNLIGVDDLGPIEAKFNSNALMNQLERVWEKDPKTSKWALMKCTFLAYKWQFAAGVIPRLLFSGFTFAQPFLINSIVDFVGEPAEKQSKDVSGGLIGATILIYVGLSVTNGWYKHFTFQLVTMYRGGLASLVFKKTLVLHSAATKDSAPVTLMSTDVESIVTAGSAIHDIWSSLVELPVAIYLLYRHVGIPSLFILIPTVLTTVAGGIISPAMGPARVKWNQAIQERIGSASNMLGQMKGIKMMGLTDFFHNLLQGLRVIELKLSVKFRLILVQLHFLALISEEITPIIIILAAIFWTKANEGLSISEAFTSLSIISIASAPLVMIMVSIMQIFGAIGCFTRIQQFLMLEERKDSRELPRAASPLCLDSYTSDTESIQPKSESSDVELGALSRNITSPSIMNSSIDAITFEDATFSATEGVDVLKDISLKVPPATLTMIVGRVGCGKSSLLKAIAGELNMTKGRVTTNTNYTAYCDQTPWLQNLSIRGNILGQSSLDEKWLATVIRTCALDEDISLFPLGDLTIVGSGGVALSGGQRQRVALARAVYSRRSLLVLDDVFSGLDSKTAKTVFQRLFGAEGLTRRRKTTVIMATNHVNFLPAADYITVLDEGRVVKNQVSYDSVEPSVWGVLQNDSDTSSVESDAEDEEHSEKTSKIPTESTVPVTTKTDVELSRQTGDIDSYRIYFESMGWAIVIICLASIVFHVGVQKMPQIWLRLWTQKGTGAGDLGYMGAYVAFAVGSLFLGTVGILYFFVVAVPRSANYLHQLLLTSVMRAPLFFFTSTDSGITLNRFSQDMTLIDNALPMAFWSTAYCLMKAVADVAVIASGATYVAAVIPVCIIALYFIQKYYLRTSRQIRFLDLETKSPLYTQFSETLAGISTIRSFGWAKAFLIENHVRLDTSQKPFYMMFCIQRWLQVVLDLFIAGMALVLVAFALNLTGATSKGAIGLAMVNLIGFNQTLTAVIDQWTKLETSLGAIARLKWFRTNTPNENKEGEKVQPPVDWPSQGAIELDNVCASYSDETDLVLRGVSLKIKPGQKVGLCGRSGSGKSSLVLALSRLLELRSGSIRVDDMDLSTIPRQTIRSRITALPQDAIKFSGSVRYNIDPEGAIQADEPLISAFRKTAIWPAIESRGGLDADMNELGFSAGQLQLFCLARALLNHSSIVLLDEATSSVDLRTDEEIRRVIKEEMQGRTVVEVAHRLEVVRDCDVVVVMSEGRVLETGEPEELLSRPSAFKTLWENQGL